MHRHHVTYQPEVIKLLCVKHHEEITMINGIQGRKYRRSLSNKHRWWIWFQWIEGKLKPRRTQKAMEYIEEMRRGPQRPIVVPVFESHEPEPELTVTKRTKRKQRSPAKKKSAVKAKPSERMKKQK